MTREPEKTKKFYAASLGWSFDGMPMPTGGTYWIAKMGDTPVGGLFPMSGPEFEGVADHWFPYIAVDDVDARVKKATANGGELARPAFDVPGIGRIAIIKEPTGAMVGWMTPAPQQQ